MKKATEISRLELLEHVALPMGNLSRALEALLDRELEMDSQDLKQGLRSIQANAESIYRFLTFEEEQPTSVVGRRTPQVLRQFVAGKCRTGYNNEERSHSAIGNKSPIMLIKSES